LGCAVVDESHDVIAEAQDVLVMFDFGANAKCAIPDTVRDRLRALQGARG
jgi:acyl-CoA thioesterase FadM